MPFGSEVQVTIDEAAVAALLRTTNGPVGQWMEAACLRVQAAATRLCPVRTGRLRASISHQVTIEDGELAGYVGSNVEYAPFVELGTYKMAARPFLRPALSAV